MPGWALPLWTADEAGGNRNILDLAAFTPAETFIHVVEG